jgi:hypothetical protein
MEFSKERPAVTELVYGILGWAFIQHKTDQFTRIPRDQVYIGLKELADKHPAYFRRIYFADRGGLPHSKEIEDALFRLGGVIAVENPKNQYLRFNETELGHVESKLGSWFDDETRASVKSLAEEFYGVVKHRKAMHV